MAVGSPITLVWTPFAGTHLPTVAISHGRCQLAMLGTAQEPLLRARCAIPDELFCYRLTVEAPLGESDYVVTIFGPQALPATPPAAPRISLLASPDPLVLLAALRCVYHRGTALWLEALWTPANGHEIDIRGLAQPHRKKETSLIYGGLKILQSLAASGGRLPAMDGEAFTQFYYATYRTLLDEARRDGDRLPTRLEVATAMLISRKTFFRYRVRHHLPFPPTLS